MSCVALSEHSRAHLDSQSQEFLQSQLVKQDQRKDPGHPSSETGHRPKVYDMQNEIIPYGFDTSC